MTTALETVRPVGAPARVSQGTAIEQSRAIAQVQAMVIVAQQCPRSTQAAIRAMEEACRQEELAQRAFFRFPRAGETVSGPSVHLARELARCWGNIEHGVTELRRDDLASESEMQAFAWDLETNTRSASIFIVPHKRDTRAGVKDLTDMRDIYENNANNGARRLREAIFSVLPVWYREQAIALCQKTLEDGGGKPLATRIAEAVKAFEQRHVSPARLAAKFGHDSVDDLTAVDLGQLAVIYDSLKQGTITVDDEFPPEQPRVTAADITGQPAQQGKPARRGRRAPEDPSPADRQQTPRADATAGPPAAESAGEAPDDRPPAGIASGQRSQIEKEFKRLGIDHETEDGYADMLTACARIVKVAALAALTELTQDEAAQVIATVKPLPDGGARKLADLLKTGEKPAADSEANNA
jgi:hypothetical protein